MRPLSMYVTFVALLRHDSTNVIGGKVSAQLYSVTPHPIETILTWVKSKAIAIPEIQRPFVWENAKVRDLLDSLYRGYPVGYISSHGEIQMSS